MDNIVGTIDILQLSGEITTPTKTVTPIYVNDYVFINNHTIVQTFSPIEEDGEG